MSTTTATWANCAELCADTYQLSREELDAFAISSYQKAIKAQREGLFKEEILPVQVPQGRREPLLVEHDEEPTRVNFEKLPQLTPAFKKDGKVTAGNASSINDGAAAVVVVGRDVADKMGLQPMARIVAHSDPCPTARMVYHRPGGCDQEGVGQGWSWHLTTSTCSRSTKPLRRCRWR